MGLKANIKDTASPAYQNARLGIEVTKRCNSSCIHCFAGAGRNCQVEIPRELLNGIIHEGSLSGYRRLHLTGGEPLLHKAVFTAIDSAVAWGYESILLNTNGRLLDRHTAQRLASHPKLTLSVSLDASEDLHDRFRGKGSWQEALKGLESGLEAGLNIIVYTLVCRSGMSVLPRFVDDLYARYPGIRFITFNRLRKPFASRSALEQEFLTPEEFLPLVRIVSLLNAFGRPVVLLDDPLINVVSQQTGMPALPTSEALERPGDIMVLADLTLAPSHNSGAVCGFYVPGAMAKRWFSGRYRLAVAPDQLVCPLCRHLNICRTNALTRPVGRRMDDPGAKHFCQAVLDLLP